MRKAGGLAIVYFTVIGLSAQPLSRQNSAEDSTLTGGTHARKALAAPKSDGGYQFTKGTLVFNAGVSVGVIGDYSYGAVGGTGFLPVTLSGEYSLNELVGVSAYFGFYGRNYGNGAIKYDVTTFGGRVAVHFTDLLNGKLKTQLPEKLDLYATLILGYRINSWSSNDPNAYSPPANDGKITFGPAVGARYMFIKNVGVYLELGRGPMGVLGTGLSVKF